MHATTPDGRYFVVKGQLWRCSNPALSDEQRQQLVHDLMQARRAVKEAKASNDAEQLRNARVYAALLTDNARCETRLVSCKPQALNCRQESQWVWR